MSVGTALVIGAGAAAVGGVASAIIGANAAKGAGEATLSAAQQQVAMAREALQAQIQARAEGISTAQKAAAMSPEEIKSINNILTTQGASLSASMASLQKQQSQLDAMDPTVKAAGQNLYDLLTGKAAAVLAPMQKQLDFQRNQLMSQLSSQMGPGFMASSAGIMALTQFDNQAALNINNAQMNAIQTIGGQYANLGGLQQQGQAGVTQGTLNAFGQAQNANVVALGGYEAGQQRMVNATLGAMSANPINAFGVPNAQGSVIDAAGLPYAGAGVAATAIGQAAGGVANIFGNYGAAGMQQNNINTLLQGLQPRIGSESMPVPAGNYSGNVGAMIA